MATVDDYASGKILKDVKLTNYSLKLVKIPIFGSLVKKKLFKRIKNFEPKLIDMDTASLLIHESEKCAVGERVCKALNKDSDITESVFLDELAEEMVRAGKARYTEKKEAIDTLKKYPKNPLILAKVSDKYMEICRSYPQDCIFYKMQRQHMKCLNKFRKKSV